jgi:hypothetical protein
MSQLAAAPRQLRAAAFSKIKLGHGLQQCNCELQLAADRSLSTALLQAAKALTKPITFYTDPSDDLTVAFRHRMWLYKQSADCNTAVGSTAAVTDRLQTVYRPIQIFEILYYYIFINIHNK